MPEEEHIGRWDVLDVGPEGSQILAMHAALLPPGKVLYFAGSEHDGGQNSTGEVDHTRLWDIDTHAIETLPSPVHDLFCAGHALLGDGRLLTAGGTAQNGFPGGRGQPGFLGLRDTTIFDPSALPAGNPWVPAAPMNPMRGSDAGGGRWYPTLVTMADGRVFQMSGSTGPGDERPINTMIEVFDPLAGSWLDLGDQPDAPPGYVRLALLPDGRVLCASPMLGATRAWDPETGTWADVCPGAGLAYGGYNTTGALLPLLPEEGYRARFLLAGAPQPLVLDLGAPEHGWQPTGPRGVPGSPFRNHGVCVLLPDATAVVVGGSATADEEDAVLAAEVYDPRHGHWSLMAEANVPRVYHSTALLLPDGRVWTCGSNFHSQGGVENRELRMETFSPPYLFRGPRPEIAQAPTSVAVPPVPWGPGTLRIGTPQAAEIQSVALMRCGSVTHAFDFDQRHVGLAIAGRQPDAVVVTSPPSAAVAPPGWYMLFVVGQAGVPSFASFVRVQPPAWTGPIPVPGLLADETQGADLAIADLSGTGRPDLVVFHVDNSLAEGGADAENAGYYRVGFDLDGSGAVTGGWADLVQIPGTFGLQTQGGGVAVADVSRTGRPDLVVFHVENPEGENAGFYRIGWDLDAAGSVTGGWTAPVQIPGPFGLETQGGGVAVADVDGDGAPDLVVFHVENPEGENTGYYRIGWGLDAAGNVTAGWTGPIAVGGGFGTEGFGGGIAVVDLTGNGRPDLVAFHLEGVPGGAAGHYRIGWDLDPAGNVTGGWTAPFPAPGQVGRASRGGIAVADLDGGGMPALLVFHVDNPEGQNRAYYRVLLT